MSTDTSTNQVLQRVDIVDTNLAKAILFLAGALWKLASAHPICSGACPGTASTCGELEDTVTDLVQDVARALMAAKHCVGSFGQQVRDPHGMSDAERTDIEQALVDRAVTLDAATHGLRSVGRQLGELPQHRDAAAVISYITIGLIPASYSLGDLIEILLS